MKPTIALATILAVLGTAPAWAVATINLNNYDAGSPIYYWDTATLVPVAGTFVQLVTPQGPVVDIATQTSILTLTEPGYFYGGVGMVPGLADDAITELTLRVWRGAPTWAAATEKWSATWAQATGNWNPEAVPPTPPIGAALYNPPLCFCIPEPGTMGLGVAGGAALLFCRGAAPWLKTLRAQGRKP